MRIGIDWGGTKLEVIALDYDGTVLLRERIPTPPDYDKSLEAVCGLIAMAETEIGRTGTVGIGIPGTISPATGLIKNANSVWLNGKPLKQDLETRLEREVRIQNDANCFAVSEAVDGAGEGCRIVAGVILGTGCGCGIAIEGQALFGHHGIAGEFGHTPLANMNEEEFSGELCWCGKRGCVETWISGTGFQRDYQRRSGEKQLRPGSEIVALGSAASIASYEAYCDRLARSLSVLVNILDPDIFVLGGGMSNVDALYGDVPRLMKSHVFSDVFDTPMVKAKYGDSSGVRGAAWLWQ
ncbi:MAG: ROK family protein [Pseudomonadota bacterium]